MGQPVRSPAPPAARVILSYVALSIAVACLAYVLHNGRKLRRLRREIAANYFLSAVLTSHARHLREQREALIRDTNRRLADRPPARRRPRR